MKHSDVALLMRGIGPALVDLVEERVRPLLAECEGLRKELAKALDASASLQGFVEQRVSASEKAISEELGARPVFDPAALMERVDASVREAVAAIPPAEPGKSVTIEDLRPLIREEVAALPLAEPGKPGKPADPEETAALVQSEVEKAVGALRATTEAALPGMVDEAVGKAVSDLPKPEDGKSPDPEVVARQIDEAVAKRFEGIRQPEDGKSVKMEDVLPAIAELVAKAVAEIPAAKDGRGVADLIVNHKGVLVVTFTDGNTKEVAEIVGRDADMPALRAALKEMVDAIPRPKDGLDGIGFDDMAIALSEDERTLTISAEKGEKRKEWPLRLNHVLDRGVYREGQAYVKGDGVTWGGSFWIAQDDTSDRPDSGKGWRLAVKKGRDGKDAPAKLLPVKS